MYLVRAMRLAAAMAATTCGGAPAGATARPSGPTVAAGPAGAAGPGPGPGAGAAVAPPVSAADAHAGHRASTARRTGPSARTALASARPYALPGCWRFCTASRPGTSPPGSGPAEVVRSRPG